MQISTVHEHAWQCMCKARGQLLSCILLCTRLLFAMQPCPGGKAPVQCKMNPCKRASCHKDEECVVHRCGVCKATCRKSSVICPDGSLAAKCLNNPCAATLCAPGTRCEVDRCDGCLPVCRPTTNGTTVPGPSRPLQGQDGAGKDNHGNQTGSSPAAFCADGSSPVNCLVDPCKDIRMKCKEGHVCGADYCGGCKATCVPVPPADLLAESRVMAANASTCSDGSKPVNCLADPCISATCLAGEVCEADYCGGCKAICKPPASPMVPAPSICKDGSRPVQCFVDPCKTKKCGEGELCLSDYCGGCNAICQPAQAPKPESKEPSTCADGSTPANCLVDPCKTTKCADEEVCEADYCSGSCKGLCKKPVSTDSPSTNGTCADGSKPVNCLVDPCISTTCLAGETCEADYCGGCKAVCKPPASPWVPAPITCKDGSNPVECFVDPCETKGCKKEELCLRDYCGACNAVCAPAHVDNKPRVLPAVGSSAGKCSDGSNPVNCLMDPCISATCPAGEVCEADYCGGCNAVCKKPVGSLPSGTGSLPSGTSSLPAGCSDGSRPVNCLVDPCTTARCGYGLVCESNYCGGCNAVCKAP